ncbi:dihydrofolate reductase family protein [Nocardia sp. NBC_00511]|uniref:dihydrofolate reductase family protein n=1 Tax=Nocardia sp. NBC_00511 TaxID=2903591 RepID=UPI0030E1E1ED
MRKLTYFAAVSIDGYIAGPRGEFDFYPLGEDQIAWVNENYPDSVPVHVRDYFGMPRDIPNKHWDTVLMGRGSYEPGLTVGVANPYPHLKQYVFSRTLAAADCLDVEIVDTDPVALVQQLKKEAGLDIWLCGGGNLATQLLGEIDHLIIKSYPVVAGGGIPLFGANFQPTRFRVTERRQFDNGTQMSWFDRA